jgi:ADP-heptose:LPS heptosyltransferase
MSLKSLELLWRRFWIRILVRLMRRSSGARPDWAARPYRVLFLRHDRAGDMIVSTGVMRAIVQFHPTITLDVLASPVNASILDAADYVGDVVVFDKKRLASYLPTALRLRRARYDAVIDCMVTAPSLTTLLLIWASGARQRIGIAGRGNDAAFTITVPADARSNAHMVDRLAALAAAFDLDPHTMDKQPVIVLTDDERAWAEQTWSAHGGLQRVLINVSAGAPIRFWPDNNYVAVMRYLRGRGGSTIFRVIGSPAEAQRAENIAHAGGGVYVRTATIRQAFALVAAADFVFTPDTSITHATSAFRRPAVVIFGRGSAERWGLYGTPGENVEHLEPALETLPVERALGAIDAVWNQTLLKRPG